MERFPKASRISYEEEVINLRRMFHQIPEICYQEEKTAAKITELLTSYGITRVERMFGTGVVAILGDEEKECIAFRMDIDGLPVTEKNDIPYRSCHEGMMHACGHDAHIAILLMTAKILKEREHELPCCVKLIFEPGEEGDGGALPLIGEGVLKTPDVTRVFGAHVWPNVPLGVLEYVPETCFAGCDRFDLHISGKGGHGAMPKEAKEPIAPMAEWILGLKAIQKSEKNAVISACACQADGYYNVFPDEANVKGTIRTLNEVQRTRIFHKIDKLTEKCSKKWGIPFTFSPVTEYPPCKNDAAALEEAVTACIKTVGKDGVRKGVSTYAAEDFAFFAKECPSTHIRIGCTNSSETGYPLHNPNFQIAEECLMYGVELFCNIAFSHR